MIRSYVFVFKERLGSPRQSEEVEDSLVQSFMSVKSISVTVSILSAVSGFISAYYWYLASKVTVTPA